MSSDKFICNIHVFVSKARAHKPDLTAFKICVLKMYFRDDLILKRASIQFLPIRHYGGFFNLRIDSQLI